MGRNPAVLLLLAPLLHLVHFCFCLDSWQVGNPAAGIDIRTPLDAFQCDPWLIYYKVSPTDYGASLGVNYDDLSLQLTTPDDARSLLVKIRIPRGEGVIAWTVNLAHNSQFFVNPHGPIAAGDYVQVKLGGGGDACLSYTTRTLNDFVAYNPPAFHSVQSRTYPVTARPPPVERATSPSAGLQTHFAAGGVVVAPGGAVTTSADPSTSVSSDPSSQTETSGPQSDPTVGAPVTTGASSPSSSGDHGAPAGSSPTPNAGGVNGGDPASDQHGQKNSVPVIVGSVIAGLVLIASAIFFFLFARRRRNRIRRMESAAFMHIDSETDLTGNGTMTSNQSSIRLPRRDFKPAATAGSGVPAFFAPESNPRSSAIDSTAPSSHATEMDLARALAVVAAHVRSGEDLHAGPGDAPPTYTHTVSNAASRSVSQGPTEYTLDSGKRR